MKPYLSTSPEQQLSSAQTQQDRQLELLTKELDLTQKKLVELEARIKKLEP